MSQYATIEGEGPEGAAPVKGHTGWCVARFASNADLTTWMGTTPARVQSVLTERHLDREMDEPTPFDFAVKAARESLR